MINAPLIESSSEEERRAFIKNKYPCIADCDSTFYRNITFYKASGFISIEPEAFY